MMAQNNNESIDVNSRMSLSAAIYLGVIGPAIFIVQPAFVQGMVEFYKFSEQQAGYVASTEMWGIAIATFALVFIAGRVNWRSLLVIGAILACAGNLMSIFTNDVTIFSALRFLTGIGSGILVSLTFTIVGLSANPDRNFGFMIMWILVYGAIGFLLLPLAYNAVGMQGVLIFFAVFNLSALPFIRYLPIGASVHSVGPETGKEIGTLVKMLAIAAMFIYFLAQGVVWAYLFLIGIDAGVSEQSVTYGLTLSQFLGIAGALLAAIVANRYGRISPLAIGIALSVISLGFMFGSMTAVVYAAAVCLFNFAWNMTHPYLLAAMASFDRSGQIVVYAVAAQMFGLAVGPALAASTIGEGQYVTIIQLGIALFVLAFLVLLTPLLKLRSESR